MLKTVKLGTMEDGDCDELTCHMRRLLASEWTCTEKTHLGL